MPKSNQHLKKCPWCGSDAKLIEVKLWQEHSYKGQTMTHGYPGNYDYVVQCTNGECLAEAPGGRIDDIYRSPETAKEIAIEIWNTRKGKSQKKQPLT